MTPFLKQVGKLVAFIKGKPYTVTSDNEKYSLFEEALNKGVTEDDLLELISNKAKIEKQIKHFGFCQMKILLLTLLKRGDSILATLH